ncbi:MAG: 5'-3' exonuclease [Acidimicrobiales bacterium]
MSSPSPTCTEVYLVDGTYELFRHYFGAPAHRNSAGEEVGAARAVVGSLLKMLEGGASHVGVATDHVIESWRNDAWPSYKSSAGAPADLLSQFGLFEEALATAGFLVWPMTELEADDALASAAAVLADDKRVARALICTPDKDLAQCVSGERVVCLDRRRGRVIDEAAVRARFGVGPASVPDWLGLVGDSSDGYPGVPGWGPKAAAAVLARFCHIELVPSDPTTWDVGLPHGRAVSLAASLAAQHEQALLFKRLATCTLDPGILPPGQDALDSLEWRGPEGKSFAKMCARLEAPAMARRYQQLAATKRRCQN